MNAGAGLNNTGLTHMNLIKNTARMKMVKPDSIDPVSPIYILAGK
jgi:hypothetical protein